MIPASGLKDIAISFLRLAAAGNVDRAYGLVTPGFRHHNPYFASGADALKAGMRETAAAHPGNMLEVQRAVAEGDLVAVRSRVEMAEAAVVMAVVHIFRVEKKLIAELWDIGQARPA